MGNGLKLVLRSPLFRLALKGILWMASVMSIEAYGASWLTVGFFVFASLFFYKGRHDESLYRFRGSFIVLYILALLGIFHIQSTYIMYGTLFFVLIGLCVLGGIRDLIFLNRQFLYRLLQFFIYIAVFVAFFLSLNAELFLVKYALLFITLLVLIKEGIDFLGSSMKYKSRLYITIIAVTLVFIILEITWGLALLSPRPLHAGSMMTLVLFLMFDYLINSPKRIASDTF